MVKLDIERIVLATGHLSDVIETYISKYQGLDIIISKEESPLGTGGALRKASHLISDQNVLVLNGDTIIEFNIKKMFDFHISHFADFTMCLTSQNPIGEYGRYSLHSNNRTIDIHPKKLNFNHYTNAGIYIIKKEIIHSCKIEKTSLEDEDILNWLNTKRSRGYLVHSPLFDIGTPERYKIFLDAFSKRLFTLG